MASQTFEITSAENWRVVLAQLSLRQNTIQSQKGHHDFDFGFSALSPACETGTNRS